MIVSVHIASVGARAALGALRRPPDPPSVPGLRYAETTITAPLGEGSPLTTSRLDPLGLIAAWDEDSALDEFMHDHPLASLLAEGWMTRLEPLRVSGAWPDMPGLPEKQLPVADDEPVAALTLGRLRLHRTRPFLHSAAPAEREVASAPGKLAAIGFGRPPRLVSTFSLWRSAAAMRDYAYRKAGTHMAAVQADRERPFHRESAFIRFRPYASQGTWNGHDPLAGLIPTAA